MRPLDPRRPFSGAILSLEKGSSPHVTYITDAGVAVFDSSSANGGKGA